MGVVRALLAELGAHIVEVDAGILKRYPALLAQLLTFSERRYF
ncbi:MULTISPECIES: hypothetical protein [Prauserella salsuginis group]|uniref:Uncharacterized protein n=1 Tax=Prauserella salsuginis TaxID=387889 RepID=A0ABW6G5T3_9PSEU|nr:hypothetical protein [Prauserella flava]